MLGLVLCVYYRENQSQITDIRRTFQWRNIEPNTILGLMFYSLFLIGVIDFDQIKIIEKLRLYSKQAMQQSVPTVLKGY